MSIQQILVPDFNRLRVVATGVQSVTRNASNDTGSALLGVNVDQAVAFMCFVSNPSASPAYSFETPYITFNTSGADSGKVLGNKWAYYDPSVQVVKFQVNASTIHPSYASAETWVFRYYFFAQQAN